jgi:hypothetical protein
MVLQFFAASLYVKKSITKVSVSFYEITYPDTNSEKGFLISACESIKIVPVIEKERQFRNSCALFLKKKTETLYLFFSLTRQPKI